MTWGQRLRRVLNIDIETCRACGGALRIIGCNEDPGVIEKILDHLHQKAIGVDSALGYVSPETFELTNVA